MNFRGRHSGHDRPSEVERELSPDALAKELVDLRKAQAELTRTIDRLAGQIDALQSADLAQAAFSPPAPSELQAAPTTAATAGSPPPPPPGFALRAGSSSVSGPPPPPIEAKPSTSPPPPPVATDTKLSPLDRLLGEDFGKPRVHAPTEPQSAPIRPKFAASDAPRKESVTPPVPEPDLHVSPLLGDRGPVDSTDEVSSADQEGSAPSQSQTTKKPAPPFSFSATLDQLRADEPSKNGQKDSAPSPSPSPTASTAKASVPSQPENAVGGQPAEDTDVETAAPDFFRSDGQSFASAAAMVSDILAATPDAVGAESGQPEVEGEASRASDEPSAPEVPITPDFFTAQPKKRFRLRR